VGAGGESVRRARRLGRNTPITKCFLEWSPPREGTMMKAIAGLVAALALAGPAAAQTQDVRGVAKSLQAGGYVIVLRPGGPNPDQADTDPLNLDNVAQQRQLSEAGRQQAREVGAALKALQVPIGQVITSRFNRAVETGRLIGGKEVATTADVSEGGQVVTPIE